MQFPKISILPSQKILENPVVQGGHSVRPKNRVCTGPGKPGKSWNFGMEFSRTGKSWKKAAGPGKFLRSAKLN